MNGMLFHSVLRRVGSVAILLAMAWGVIGGCRRGPRQPQDADLYRAAERGDVAALGRYIDAGGDVNAVLDRDGEPVTALHLASAAGHLPVVRGLIKAGADPNA